jgi:hypothetical protein
MAPTTVPMKNGVSSEEKANAAPAARCQASLVISLNLIRTIPACSNSAPN